MYIIPPLQAIDYMKTRYKKNFIEGEELKEEIFDHRKLWYEPMSGWMYYDTRPLMSMVEYYSKKKDEE